MMFASFWASIVTVLLFYILILIQLLFSNVDPSVSVFSAISTVIVGIFCWSWFTEESQQPGSMMIGMLGMALWLTVFFIGCAFYQYDFVISWTLLLGSLWWYMLSFNIFFYVDRKHLEYYTVGVKIKWIRVICSYFATLPLFLLATKLLWLDAIFHFSVFLFYFEACLIHRASEFREFPASEEPCSRYSCYKWQIGTIKVSEEERKKLAYRILNSVDFFTDFEK